MSGTKKTASATLAERTAQHTCMRSFLKDKQGGMLGNNIKWNFTKFLVDRNGKVIDRFAPVDKPEKLESKIKELL